MLAVYSVVTATLASLKSSSRTLTISSFVKASWDYTSADGVTVVAALEAVDVASTVALVVLGTASTAAVASFKA